MSYLENVPQIKDMIRKNISKKDWLLVSNRDCWTCQYCGKPVFFAPTLKLLNQLSPNHGYFHPNGKIGEMIDIFQWGWATVDHIIPVTKGGENSLANYVTSCWKCNLELGNKSNHRPSKKILDNNTAKIKWDGLSSLYVKLSPKKDAWTKLIEKLLD